MKRVPEFVQGGQHLKHGDYRERDLETMAVFTNDLDVPLKDADVMNAAEVKGAYHLFV